MSPDAMLTICYSALDASVALSAQVEAETWSSVELACKTRDQQVGVSNDGLNQVHVVGLMSGNYHPGSLVSDNVSFRQPQALRMDELLRDETRS